MRFLIALKFFTPRWQLCKLFTGHIFIWPVLQQKFKISVNIQLMCFCHLNLWIINGSFVFRLAFVLLRNCFHGQISCRRSAGVNQKQPICKPGRRKRRSKNEPVLMAYRVLCKRQIFLRIP